MSDKVFDTIILIYAISEGDARALIAERLLTSGGILSVQVLNEFAAVAKKKLKMSWREIAEALRIANIPILKDRSLEVNRKKRSRKTLPNRNVSVLVGFRSTRVFHEKLDAIHWPVWE